MTKTGEEQLFDIQNRAYMLAINSDWRFRHSRFSLRIEAV
jgi:hypothetical protein